MSWRGERWGKEGGVVGVKKCEKKEEMRRLEEEAEAEGVMSDWRGEA